MLSRQRNQPSKITVHHNPKPQTRLNLPIRPPRLRRLLPPNRRQSRHLVLKRLPIILHRVLCTTLPLDAQGGIKGGLDLPFRLALRCPAPMDSGFRRNDGNCAGMTGGVVSPLCCRLWASLVRGPLRLPPQDWASGGGGFIDSGDGECVVRDLRCRDRCRSRRGWLA